MERELPIWAKRIRGRREELRLTRDEVADELGLSAKSIQKYEEGRQSPPIDRLEVLARVLRTSKSYLLGESEEGLSLPGDLPSPHGLHGISEVEPTVLILLQLWEKLKRLEEGQQEILRRLDSAD